MKTLKAKQVRIVIPSDLYRVSSTLFALPNLTVRAKSRRAAAEKYIEYCNEMKWQGIEFEKYPLKLNRCVDESCSDFVIINRDLHGHHVIVDHINGILE